MIKDNDLVQDLMPTIFLAHGSPFSIDDRIWMSEWYDWAQQIQEPDSILVISAHWEAAPISIGAVEPVPLYYDFYGFPEHYYRIQYPSPGAPELAKRVIDLIGVEKVVKKEHRGLDHGAYIPLLGMYPKADIPILQLSLPSMDPNDLFKLGQSLSPLRKENVLIMGSGFITHNLRLVNFDSNVPKQWTKEFDTWVKDALESKDTDSLLQYKEKAPHVDIALPTHEHFVPLIVAYGAALNELEEVSFPVEGYVFGNFTKRSVQFR